MASDDKDIQALRVLWEAHKASGEAMRAAAAAYLKRSIKGFDVACLHVDGRSPARIVCKFDELLYGGPAVEGHIYTVDDGMNMLEGGSVRKGEYDHWLVGKKDVRMLANDAGSLLQEVIGHDALSVTWSSFFPREW
jgi:hypothetical protein